MGIQAPVHPRVVPHWGAVHSPDMPELPEVEFARTCLERWLVNKPLAKVEVDQTRVTRGSSVEAIQELAGHKLKTIERHGKWLFGKFDGGLGMLSHLGMTGKYELQEPKDPP